MMRGGGGGGNVESAIRTPLLAHQHARGGETQASDLPRDDDANDAEVGEPPPTRPAEEEEGDSANAGGLPLEHDLLRSLAASSATLACSLLGTGVLSQAEACKDIGVAFFVVLSMTMILVSHATGAFLVHTAIFLNERDYRSVVGNVYGDRGKLLTGASVVIQQLGACTGYVVVCGDVFGPLVEHWFHIHHVKLWAVRVVLVSCVIAPLSFARELTGTLRYTSAASVFAVVFFCCTIVVNAGLALSDDGRRAKMRGDDEGEVAWLPRDAGALRSVPLICFAYFMHFNALPVYYAIPSSLKKRVEVYVASSVRAFAIAGSATILTGVMGYVTFLDATESDILTNFKVRGTYISSFMNVVRAMYGLGLLLAFPVILFEARSNVFGLMHAASLVVADSHGLPPPRSATPSTPVVVVVASENGERTETIPLLRSSSGGGGGPAAVSSATATTSMTSNTTSPTNRETLGRAQRKREGEEFQVPRSTFVGVTLALLILTTVLGCVVSDLGAVFGLVGSTVTPLLSYILPCATYLRSGAADRYGHATLARLILAWGCFLIPLGVIVYFLDLGGIL